MEFLFECSTRYLTYSLRSLVRYRVKHLKKFHISAHPCIIIYLKQQNENSAISVKSWKSIPPFRGPYLWLSADHFVGVSFSKFSLKFSIVLLNRLKKVDCKTLYHSSDSAILWLWRFLQHLSTISTWVTVKSAIHHTNLLLTKWNNSKKLNVKIQTGGGGTLGWGGWGGMWYVDGG